VSTHSDYIIREVNNLIMANTVCKNDRECVEELGYSADMLLNKEDVQVKYFNYTKSKKVLDVVDINVVDDGFAVESIDNTINNQNKITEILFDRLQEDLS
ncbi:MAG: hypothetical protein J5826_00745, partial [Bacteroidales bacterium]|nr:hypothetical protein [Bacteroidales bacterium]